jgi:hypothetical protein
VRDLFGEHKTNTVVAGTAGGEFVATQEQQIVRRAVAVVERAIDTTVRDRHRGAEVGVGDGDDGHGSSAQELRAAHEGDSAREDCPWRRTIVSCDAELLDGVAAGI